MSIRKGEYSTGLGCEQSRRPFCASIERRSVGDLRRPRTRWIARCFRSSGLGWRVGGGLRLSPAVAVPFNRIVALVTAWGGVRRRPPTRSPRLRHSGTSACGPSREHSVSCGQKGFRRKTRRREPRPVYCPSSSTGLARKTPGMRPSGGSSCGRSSIRALLPPTLNRWCIGRSVADSRAGWLRMNGRAKMCFGPSVQRCGRRLESGVMRPNSGWVCGMRCGGIRNVIIARGRCGGMVMIVMSKKSIACETRFGRTE